MAEKQIINSVVAMQKKIADDVYDLWLRVPDEVCETAVPGQFVSLYCSDGSRLLPRPISICEIDPNYGALRLVYRTVGKGTEEFSRKKAGDEIRLLGPLGNGFDVSNPKDAMLIGGGIGIPPMLELAKQLNVDHKTIVLGYSGGPLFLKDDLAKRGSIYVSTDDGSAGTHGTVMDAIRDNNLKADVIYACGPKVMLRAVKEFAEEKNIECWVSMEERMACGIGACLGCVCKTTEVDEHSHVKNRRVCKDGPVFNAREVDLS